MICLDTSAYSHFMRGRPAAVEVVVGSREIVVPTVVVGELRFGFALGSKRRDNETELREFLKTDVVRLAGVDEPTTRHYADILIDLRNAGTPIPTNDVWIAATAAANGATLVTYDDHFRRVDRVASIIL